MGVTKIDLWFKNIFKMLVRAVTFVQQCDLVDVNYLDRSATTILAGGSGE